MPGPMFTPVAQYCYALLKPLNFMKSTALIMYVILILVTTMIFAVVYGSFKNVVETYPVTFSLILITTLMVGMYGITDNIIFNQAHTKYTKK